MTIGGGIGVLSVGFRSYVNIIFNDPLLVSILAGIGFFSLLLLAALCTNWLLCAIFWRCPSCGKVLGTNLRVLFCGVCGKRLD